MRKYFPNEIIKYNNTIHGYNTIRVAYIQSVDPVRGTVDIKWLDHPGTRTNVVINQSSFGDFEFPVIGSMVLVGMRAEFPEILRYIPLSYATQVANGLAPQLHEGEKVFRSYKSRPDNTNPGAPTPVATGSEIFMDNSGRIKLSTGLFDSITIDPLKNSIETNSMNTKISTEAGVLDFGLIRRDGNFITNGFSPGDKPLTEFRLRVSEYSDFNPATPADEEDPFIEVSLGTAIQNGAPEEIDGKKIALKIKVKNDSGGIGFKFIVDKSGNVEMSVDGKLIVKCDDIELGDDGGEALVTKGYLTDMLNHTHPDPTSGYTGTGTMVVQSTAYTSKVKAL
jgi:hypothetical protein